MEFLTQVSDSLVCNVHKAPSETHTLILIGLKSSNLWQEVVSSHANQYLCSHVQTQCTLFKSAKRKK